MKDDPRYKMILEHYEGNAEVFFSGTVDVDMAPLYERFLPLLPGRRILDAGCGSGRDALAFLKAGFEVEAFDASPELAKMASELSGLKVEAATFHSFRSEHLFDGIWACASLLHVPAADLSTVIERLASMLQPGGIFYMSFKWGRAERVNGGRLFVDLDEEGLDDLLENIPELVRRELWQTRDLRPGRDGEFWLNAIMEKKS